MIGVDEVIVVIKSEITSIRHVDRVRVLKKYLLLAMRYLR